MLVAGVTRSDAGGAGQVQHVSEVALQEMLGLVAAGEATARLKKSDPALGKFGSAVKKNQAGGTRDDSANYRP